MRPRRTPYSNAVFSLQGDTEDNDLWVERTTSDNGPCLRSVWELTPEERRAVMDGANVYLVIWGTATPPVALGITDDELGASHGRRP